MNTRRALTKVQGVVAIIIVVVAVVAGVYAWQAFNPPSSSREILIGASISLTGPISFFGLEMQWAYQHAVDLVNKEGGIDIDGMGRLKVRLIIYDDKSDFTMTTVITNVDKLVTVDKADFLLGPAITPFVAVAAGEAEKFHVPLITGGTSSIALREQGFKYVFIAFISADQYPKVFFEMLTKLPSDQRPKTIAIWAENTGLGTETAEQVEKIAPTFGMTVVLDEVYPPGATDYTDLITKTKGASPDLVMGIPDTRDAITFIRQSRQLDLNPKLFLFPRGAGTTGFYDGLGKDGEYVVDTSTWDINLDYPGNKQLVEDYRAAGNDPTKVILLGAWYALPQILLEAIKTARSLDREKVRQVLLTNTFSTIEGPVKFNEKGVATLTVVVFQWQQGAHVAVYPESLASAKLKYPAPTWSQR